MRKIKEFKHVTPDGVERRACVYRHADWDEYFVRLWINDKAINGATYHTDDRDDAIATADYWVNKE